MMATVFKAAPGKSESGGDVAEDVFETAGRRARLEAGGRVVRHEPAFRDDDGAGADRIHLFEDVRRDDDGLLARDFADERANLVFLQRIESVRGLVEDQDL